MTNLETLLKYLFLKEDNATDYKGEHSAPDKNDTPIWNVSPGAYPEDFYTLPTSIVAKYYGEGKVSDSNIVDTIKNLHNKPKAKVKIYRSVPAIEPIETQISNLEDQKRYILKYGKVPKGIHTTLSSSQYYDQIYDTIEILKSRLGKEEPVEEINKINPGDWVTIWRPYAVEHGKAHLKNKYKILSKTVLASEVYTDGNSLYEFGWDP